MIEQIRQTSTAVLQLESSPLKDMESSRKEILQPILNTAASTASVFSAADKCLCTKIGKPADSQHLKNHPMSRNNIHRILLKVTKAEA